MTARFMPALALATLAFLADCVSAAPSVEQFIQQPTMAAPKLSPSGRYLATPVRKGERMVIVVNDLKAPKNAPPGVIYTEDVEIEWIEWANEERLLVAFAVKVQVNRGPYTGSRIPRRYFETSFRRIAGVNRDGTRVVGLLTPDRRFRANRDLTQIAHMLPDAPQHVLMAANDPRSRFNLYRVNVYTGEQLVVAEGDEKTDSWLTDLNGVPRVRWDYDWRDEVYQMFVRRGDGESWDKAGQYGERDLPDLKVVGFGDDPKTAIVASRQTSDRLGLYEYDLAARQLGRLLFAHPSVDVGSPFGRLIYDPATTRLLGLTYVEDLWRVHYFDAELNRVQAEADAVFPDEAVVRVTSWSGDKSHAVLYTEGPQNPGSFYLFDRKAKTNELIGRLNPQLRASELAGMAIIRYPARDGVKLTGYLTLPPGRGDSNLPMVVLPHGGPELRDSVQYDELAQAIATQGYMVFQPNFRGSGGYGRAFAEAGHRQWGRRMQDDITDGVKALIADGSADPKRICIVGGSYGGYAALAGGAFTPELYKCVISFAGVSDLRAMVEYERKAGVESSVYRYWVARIGDPARDRDEMLAWSPAKQAKNFAAPVLLIHGEWDGIVPFKQSQTMEGALDAANKPVELIRVRRDGHNLARRESREILLTEIRRFLAQHLGP